MTSVHTTRAHQRIELSYLVAFDSPQDLAPGTGVLLDLSAGGALIGLTPSTPAVGEKLSVLITQPQGDPIREEAIVVRTEQLAFAVRFPQPSVALARLLGSIAPAPAALREKADRVVLR